MCATRFKRKTSKLFSVSTTAISIELRLKVLGITFVFAKCSRSLFAFAESSINTVKQSIYSSNDGGLSGTFTLIAIFIRL